MRDIYIVLTATGTFYARAIRLYTKKQYTHSSISLDEELSNMYSMCRKYARNPFLGEFKKEEINKGVFSFYPNCPSVVIKITVDETQYTQMNSILKDFNRKQVKYNLMGIFFRLFNKEYQARDKFFCSEMIAYLLKETNVYKFDKPLNFVEPMDLLEIPSAEIVYQGPLNNYQMAAY